MSRMRYLPAPLFLSGILAPLGALAQPIEGPTVFWSSANGGNDHCYQLLSYGNRPNKDVTWEDARDAAAAAEAPAECDGQPGYLVTIKSGAEQDFVLASVANTLELRKDQVYIGGSQGASPVEPGGSWAWGDGSAIPTGGAGYQNWLANQPDDGGGGKGNGKKSGSGLENSLALVLGSTPGWNDVGDISMADVSGAIVEWGSSAFNVAACLAGCPVGVGSVYTLPAGYEPPEEEVQEFQEFSFSFDPRVLNGTCGTVADVPANLDPDDLVQPDGTLRLFYDGAGDDEYAVIPAVYCAFNGILALVSDGGFNFPGTAEISNEIQGGGFDCDVPYTAGNDPQFQELVLFQTKNPNDMPEFDDAYHQMLPGDNAVFKGAAADVSTACGSSRGRLIGGSFILGGFSYYRDIAYLGSLDEYTLLAPAAPYELPASFDPPSDPNSSSDTVVQGLMDLAAYKFLMLSAVIEDAQLSENFVTNGVGQSVASQTENAYGQFLSGSFQNSVDVLNDNVLVDIVPESFVDPSEDYGPIDMRLRSLIFHLDKLKSVVGE